jgi:DNA repair protein RecN (Recombination protein N)
MLSYLRVRGLALLEDVTLELSPGMNVLTGETGAGKSIIIDALALLRGGRGRPELVRAGVDSANVDAQFELTAAHVTRVKPTLDHHGLPAEDVETLVLHRVLPRSGRGRSLVQGELTTQAVLGEVGQQLIDICSQHEHHSLTNVAHHIELLDGFAHLERELDAYQSAYRAYRATVAALSDVRTRAAEGLKRADYLRYQIEELERVAPEPGEYDTLRQRLTLLRDAQRWAEFARDAREALHESQDSVGTQLAVLAERCRPGAQHSPRLARVSEQLESARIACAEAAHEAARFEAELDLDAGELERAEERLHDLTALQRKHGGSIDEIAARVTAMRAELAELDDSENVVAELERKQSELLARCAQLATKLRDGRRVAASKLSRALETELGALHLARARIEAKLEELPLTELGPRGLDRAEFVFSANPGEPLAPLSRVASGGELSRVLLALKGVVTTGDSVATYVFDEVDAGVGGAVAESIGRRLSRAAAGHQVLCITHLPQIAAFAEAHYSVEKRQQEGRTITVVTRLDEDARVEEMARMLGGARVTDSARKHARQLLAEARDGTVARPASATRAQARRRS